MTGELQSKLASIVSTTEEIRSIASNASGGQVVAFAPITVRKPYLSIPIHGFYTAVSWFYVLYFESGRTTVDFLAERSYGLGLDPDRHINKHLNLVGCFRTYLQHNLNLEKSSDVAKVQRCHEWIEMCLGLVDGSSQPQWPDSDEQWVTLARNLLTEALGCFQTMLAALKMIASDDSCADVMSVWMSRVSRFRAPYEYDKIIETAASDLGLRYIDPIILRNKYFPKWNSKLSLLKAGYDFDEEARFLVEQTLVNEEELPVPISGKDIMRELNVEAGPEVGRLKAEAQRLYNKGYRNKAEIFEILRDFKSQSTERSA